jgi:hypothetical protein
VTGAALRSDGYGESLLPGKDAVRVLLVTASATASLVAVLAGLATIGSFLAYLYFVQRSKANDARDEALALAETRREVIADLRAQLASSEESRMRLETQADRRIRELETALEDARSDAREQAYQIQRLYATGLADVLAGVRRDLEAVPADVERALRRVRELLASVPPAA